MDPFRAARAIRPAGIARIAAVFTILSLHLVGLVDGPARFARAQAGVDAFGRWEQGLRRCRIERTAPGGAAAGSEPASPSGQSCQRLRLDQQLEGLLVIRWVSGAAGSRYSSRQLVFAGLLDQASPPLRCNPQGVCRPAGAMAVWVSVVAESGFDPRGLALGLPSTRRVQGLCRLDARSFQCEASDPDGRRWRAEGTP